MPGKNKYIYLAFNDLKLHSAEPESGIQYLESVVLGIDLVKNLFYFPVFVYQKSGAVNPVVALAHKFFWSPYTICLYNFLFRIGQQRKWKLVFFSEFGMRFQCIRAYADNHVTFAYQVGVVVAQVTGFGGTTRCVIFWVKIKHYFFALERLK